MKEFGCVRLRVTGSGNLKMKFQSLDNVKSSSLAPIIMTTPAEREPFKIANFKSQRAFLKLETTELNEIFRINRVVVFVKPLWSQYYGGWFFWAYILAEYFFNSYA